MRQTRLSPAGPDGAARALWSATSVVAGGAAAAAGTPSRGRSDRGRERATKPPFGAAISATPAGRGGRSRALSGGAFAAAAAPFATSGFGSRLASASGRTAAGWVTAVSLGTARVSL